MSFFCLLGDDRGQLKKILIQPTNACAANEIAKSEHSFTFDTQIINVDRKGIIEDENVSEENPIQKICHFTFQEDIFALIARKDNNQLQLLPCKASSMTKSTSTNTTAATFSDSKFIQKPSSQHDRPNEKSGPMTLDYIGLSCSFMNGTLYVVSLDSTGLLSYYQLSENSLRCSFYPPQKDRSSIMASFYQSSSIGTNVIAFNVQWHPALVEESLFAIGGSTPRPLEIWKLNPSLPTLLGSMIFKAAKDLHNDLNMSLPVTITDIDFISQPGIALPIVVVGTLQKEIRIYDTRASSNPVFRKSLSDFPIQKIIYAVRARLIVFSDTRGNIFGLDERTQRIFGKYKDCLGTVTDMMAIGSYLFVTSSDRHLRLYDLSSRELLGKCYLTQKLTCMSLLEDVMSRRLAVSDDEETDDDQEEPDDEDAELDALDPSFGQTEPALDKLWRKIPKVIGERKSK